MGKMPMPLKNGFSHRLLGAFNIDGEVKKEAAPPELTCRSRETPGVYLRPLCPLVLFLVRSG